MRINQLSCNALCKTIGVRMWKEKEVVTRYAIAVSGPTSVYWVVGESPRNEQLINNLVGLNQYNGDRLRRIFPVSQHDFSIEVVINRDVHERSYSCVIGGVSDLETTLFTYIVRSISKWRPCVISHREELASTGLFDVLQMWKNRNEPKWPLTKNPKQRQPRPRQPARLPRRRRRRRRQQRNLLRKLFRTMHYRRNRSKTCDTRTRNTIINKARKHSHQYEDFLMSLSRCFFRTRADWCWKWRSASR